MILIRFTKKVKIPKLSECDFDEIGNELPNPEERQNVRRNDDGANVMHGYNLDAIGGCQIVMEYLLWITEQIS